jgi:predicted DNA binding protein
MNEEKENVEVTEEEVTQEVNNEEIVENEDVGEFSDSSNTSEEQEEKEQPKMLTEQEANVLAEKIAKERESRAWRKAEREKNRELKDYNDFYEYLRSENNRLWNQSNLSHEELKRKYLIKKIMPELKKDMLIVKRELQRPIIWKAPLSPSGCPSWDELDMFDKKVVKELLRVHKGNDLQDDLTCIIEDLKNLIEKIDLTDKQRKILDMWSCGVTLEDIAKYTKISDDAVSRALNTIVNKIIKQYEEEYTDWYYLNICKGEYKKCSKCGEIKLVSNFCKNGNRLRGNCKNCR